ncbi:MAG: acetyl-CoA carboxylase, biotin carboxylase subunit [Mycobacterium sp.]|nr:acetyl-CoA carboxylase, biotin carboxylase subunit [Mycobacterium sp.]
MALSQAISAADSPAATHGADRNIVLVANRGEIARRVLRTCRSMGLTGVAVYSEADRHALHVREADLAVCIGESAPQASYLDQGALLEAARRTGAGVIHPGYGFLSENAAFAARVRDVGLVWVGPDPAVIAAMGDKIAARNLMADVGVSVTMGTTEPVKDVAAALRFAAEAGYPLMVKAAGGGGGIGMHVARDSDDLERAVASARSAAVRFFGSADLLLERFVEHARHVEVQILGLRDGTIILCGERDCSAQRRHQKVVEETPAPELPEADRNRMHHDAVVAGRTVGYQGVGTVEFLYDADTGEHHFLEMNTRLQVEHPITEAVTGVDLVEQQLQVALDLGTSLPDVDGRLPITGHAIEFRVYAEDPVRFRPSPGTIQTWIEPAGPGVRVDAGYAAGDTVTPFYDPLLAKLIVWGSDRGEALDRAELALESFDIGGVITNLPFLGRLVRSPEFISGTYDTGLVSHVQAGALEK